MKSPALRIGLAVLLLALSCPDVSASPLRPVALYREVGREGIRLTLPIPHSGVLRFSLRRSAEGADLYDGWATATDGERHRASGVALLAGVLLHTHTPRTHRPLALFVPNNVAVRPRLFWTRSWNTLACGERAAIRSVATAPRPRALAALPYLPIRRLTISADHDLAWYNRFGRNSSRWIGGILHSVNTLYLEQVGIHLVVRDRDGFRSPPQPYRSSVAVTLLEQFSSYLNSRRRLKRADLYHLFTGRNLADGISGVAYLGTVCRYNGRLSYGLSERTRISLQPLITAHEIGHNLGASHDLTTTSLMSPTISEEQDFFSAQSLSEIEANLAEFGTCLESESQ